MPLKSYRHRFNTMGCPAEAILYATSEALARSAFMSVETECQRLDRKYSHYQIDNYLAELQREAALPQGSRVDGETAALLNLANTQYTESQGRFDITAARLVRLWEGRTALPAPRKISEALSLTGWHRVQWDGTRLCLQHGMSLDLGGVVKEYAADRAAIVLKSLGFDSGYVDLGGDLHVLGPHPGGQPWHIGIRNPRGPGTISSIKVFRGGLATSGDYERCTFINGTRYGHIINPINGWPVAGLASVSVVAASCLIAGAVSTLAMLQESRDALEFLETSGLSWLAHDGNISVMGRQDSLEPGVTSEGSTRQDLRLGCRSYIVGRRL